MIVIACGALAKELLTLKKLNAWEALELVFLPASFHNAPQQIPERVRQKILEAKAKDEAVFVAYADCGTGGLLDQVLREYGVLRLPGAHCYEFFSGVDAFQALSDEEPATFYLTDFLVRSFEPLVIRGLGLDRYPELLEVYFGNYKRVLYLAQSHDERLLGQAQAAAQRLGLEFVYRYTSLNNLEAALEVDSGNAGQNAGQEVATL